MSDGHENEPDAAGQTPVEPPVDPRPEVAAGSPSPAVPTGEGDLDDVPDAVIPPPDVPGLDLPETDLDALLAPPADIAPVDPEALLRDAGIESDADAPVLPTTRAARRELPAPPMIPKHDPIPTDELAPASEPSTAAYRVIAGLIFAGLFVLLIAAVILIVVLATGSSTASGWEPVVQAIGAGPAPGA